MTLLRTELLLKNTYLNSYFSDCPEQAFKYSISPNPTQSKFANQILVFNGLGEVKFGELVTNYGNETCILKITGTSPHQNYKGITYMRAEVRDDFGAIIYQMVVEGITGTSYNEFSMKEGYVIEIYHLETPQRLLSSEAIVDTANTTNTWLVTRYGLKNLRLRNDPLYDFVKRLDEQAIHLLGSNVNFMDSEDLQHLFLGILSLPHPHRSLYLMKYTSMFPKCVVQPELDNTISNIHKEGSIDVTLKKDVEELIGTKVQLKLGHDLIVSDTLYEHQTQLHFEGIRLGTYSLEFHGKSAESYVFTPQYIEVKDYENFVQFDFEKINCSMLMDQTIEFYGLGRSMFAVLRASYEEGSIILSVTRPDAHPYLGNVNYAIVEVTTADAVTKFRKEITGLNNTVSIDIIPLMEDDIIKVFHKEGPNRLRSRNVVLDKSSRVNIFIVTKYGLQNRKYKKLYTLDELMKTIDAKAGDIVSSPMKYSIPFYLSEEKKHLLGAINYLPEMQKYVYLKKYRTLFPDNRGTFTISFKFDYLEELAGYNISIENENLHQMQNVKGHVVTFNYLPYGNYTIRVPE